MCRTNLKVPVVALGCDGVAAAGKQWDLIGTANSDAGDFIKGQGALAGLS